MNICFKSNNIIILALKLCFCLLAYVFFFLNSFSLHVPLNSVYHFHLTSDRLRWWTNSHNYTCHYKDASSKRQLTFSAGMMSAFEVFYVHILSIQWWRFSSTPAIFNSLFMIVASHHVWFHLCLCCLFLSLSLVVIKFINKAEFHFNSIQFVFICLWWFFNQIWEYKRDQALLVCLEGEIEDKTLNLQKKWMHRLHFAWLSMALIQNLVQRVQTLCEYIRFSIPH